MRTACQAELQASQTSTRTTAAKLSAAEVQASGFSHASASFEQNYNTVQRQIAQIRAASEKQTEHLNELQQTNSALSDALQKSDAELSIYRDRDDAGAKAIQQALEQKEAVHHKNLHAEAEISRLKRELELEKELNQHNALAMQQVESERASVVHVIAEYNRITALQKSDTAGPSCTDDSTQTTPSAEQTENCVKDEVMSK